MRSYGRLSAAFYDADKPVADDAEIDCFARYLDGLTAPALEAMCGSGRLLLPLFRRGYRLEGFDSSPFMLENLRERCLRARRTPPVTYLQSITSLSLGTSYPLIFIALGSFQLLTDAEALPALRSLYSHLQPGGRLIIDTFLPWDLIDSPTPARSTQRKCRYRDHLLHLNSHIEIEPDRQQYRQRNRYERLDGETVVGTEEEELTVRWYFPEQFLALLGQAGLSATYQAVPVASHPPRRVLYTAQA
jgi:SAM-dependent methyltransferase